MTIIETIIEAYPELANLDLEKNGICLQDDSDGQGIFIAEWTYSKPIPDGLKVGK
jgi:hypothetical protein